MFEIDINGFLGICIFRWSMFEKTDALSNVLASSSNLPMVGNYLVISCTPEHSRKIWSVIVPVKRCGRCLFLLQTFTNTRMSIRISTYHINSGHDHN